MFLIIDVGGTNIKYSCYDKSKKKIDTGMKGTPHESYSKFLSVIEGIIQTVSESFDITGIGISIPGQVSSDTGVINRGGALFFLDGKNIVSDLNKSFPYDIKIENDGKAAVLGEYHFGHLQDVDNGLVLTLGTGVGGGIIIDGQLYKGSHLDAGEFSFVSEPAGNNNPYERSAFGRTGSAVLMLEMVRLATGLSEGVSGQEIFESITPENAAAWEVFTNYCLAIAHKIIDFQYILDCERILIGGGISVQPLVVETIRDMILKINETNPWISQQFTVDKTSFGNESSQMGMLSYFV